MRALLGVFAPVCAAACAFASDDAPRRIGGSGVTIAFENDLFFDTDRYYTNGVSLAFASQPILISKQLWDRFENKLSLGRSDKFTFPNYAFGIELAQLMATPRSISNPAPDPTDRPWGGLLYLAPSYHLESRNRLLSFKVMLGVVGHWSVADRAQKFVHDKRGLEPPLGWHNQIPNEIVGGLAFEERRRYRISELNGASTRRPRDRRSEVDAEMITSIGYKVGTIENSIRVGLETRGGYRLPADFGSTQIGSTGNIPGAWGTIGPWFTGWGIHGFASISGTLVAQHVLLDGAMFHGGPGIDPEPVTARVVFGLAITSDHLRFSYQRVFLTREFRAQPDTQQFGSITLGIYW